jgi:hypothetical protein
MSTSNFHNENASCIFACELVDEFSYEDLIENLQVAFDDLHADYSAGGHDPYELRSYPSRVIAGLVFSKTYRDFSVDLEISIIIRSGYFAGCNLDWDIVYMIEGEAVFEKEFADAIEYYTASSPKMAAYRSRLAVKWAEKTEEKLIEKVEGIFRQFSTPLRVAARFSNGETIYEEAG